MPFGPLILSGEVSVVIWARAVIKAGLCGASLPHMLTNPAVSLQVMPARICCRGCC